MKLLFIFILVLSSVNISMCFGESKYDSYTETKNQDIFFIENLNITAQLSQNHYNKLRTIAISEGLKQALRELLIRIAPNSKMPSQNIANFVFDYNVTDEIITAESYSAKLSVNFNSELIYKLIADQAQDIFFGPYPQIAIILDESESSYFNQNLDDIYKIVSRIKNRHAHLDIEIFRKKQPQQFEIKNFNNFDIVLLFRSYIELEKNIRAELSFGIFSFDNENKKLAMSKNPIKIYNNNLSKNVTNILFDILQKGTVQLQNSRQNGYFWVESTNLPHMQKVKKILSNIDVIQNLRYTKLAKNQSQIYFDYFGNIEFLKSYLEKRGLTLTSNNAIIIAK